MSNITIIRPSQAEPAAAAPQESWRFLQYRDRLVDAGFTEAAEKAGCFFRMTAGDTAFIINLHDDEYGVSVLYGFARAASEGARECLNLWGSDDESCHVRNLTFIHDEASEAAAAAVIFAFYEQYKDFTGDGILAVKKERQKAFLDHFARALKPLGFRKKRTTWTKALGGGRALSFDAQKSMYSDQYYFNVTIHAETDFYTRESDKRVVLFGRDIYNWQLMTDEQTENLIRFALQEYILPNI